MRKQFGRTECLQPELGLQSKCANMPKLIRHEFSVCFITKLTAPAAARRRAQECGSYRSFASFVRIQLDLELEFEY